MHAGGVTFVPCKMG